MVFTGVFLLATKLLVSYRPLERITQEASQRALLEGLRNVKLALLLRDPPLRLVGHHARAAHGPSRKSRLSEFTSEQAHASWQRRRRTRDDDHDQHAVRPRHRRAVGVASASAKVITWHRRLPVGPATAPRTSRVEADHIEIARTF